MKELIIQALNDAYPVFLKTVPLTKKVTEYVNIQDVKPLELPEFIKNNNIPEDAWFGGKPNGYDAFDEICLCYDIDVLTNEKEREKYKKEKFSSYAWHHVYSLLLANGYKRVVYNSRLLKEFDNTSVYQMYLDKDFDRLVRYYSLPFRLSF